MKPCTRAGLETTWRCCCSCPQCFHLNNPNFRKPIDVPIEDVKAMLDKAKEGELDHAVFVGYGEPSLSPDTPAIIDYAHSLGIATSMITTGVTGLDRFKGYHNQGMDHLHFSTHGLGDTFDRILGVRGFFAKQEEVKEWAAANEWPFRTNIAIQQLNYKELPDIVEHEVDRGAYHIVLLGYLPHCKSPEQIREVAVPPKELRPYIEEAAAVAGATNFTIRYHPFCHLDSRMWPFVTNTLHVFADPWEWLYTLDARDPSMVWVAAEQMNNSVRLHGEPCDSCAMYRHCGGYHRELAMAFGGAGLRAFAEVPDDYRKYDTAGGIHDLNPANRLSGTIRKDLS